MTTSRANCEIFGFRSLSFGQLLGRDVALFLPAVRLRKGVSPVGSPGLSRIFAGSQKSLTPRTPSGPRLTLQAAGPATRPDEAGVTFPRCDTLPGIASGRYVSFITLSTVLFLTLSSSLYFRVPTPLNSHSSGNDFLGISYHSIRQLSFRRQIGKEIGSFLDYSLWIMTEWVRISLISFPLTLVIIPFQRDIGHRSIHLPSLDRAECIAIRPAAAS